jgi:hypothetical protein
MREVRFVVCAAIYAIRAENLIVAVGVCRWYAGLGIGVTLCGEVYLATYGRDDNLVVFVVVEKRGTTKHRDYHRDTRQ